MRDTDLVRSDIRVAFSLYLVCSNLLFRRGFLSFSSSACQTASKCKFQLVKHYHNISLFNKNEL